MSDYFKQPSENEMTEIKQELVDTDIDLSIPDASAASNLKPLNWQKGDIAMSPTHFYMIYNDPADGLTVKWTNRVTNESGARSDFSSREDAQDWIKNADLTENKGVDHVATTA